MGDLSKLVSQAEAQAKEIRKTSIQRNIGQNIKNTDEVILRSSVPSTYGYNGNGIDIRGGSYMSEGADMKDGVIGYDVPLNESENTEYHK